MDGVDILILSDIDTSQIVFARLSVQIELPTCKFH